MVRREQESDDRIMQKSQMRADVREEWRVGGNSDLTKVFRSAPQALCALWCISEACPRHRGIATKAHLGKCCYVG